MVTIVFSGGGGGDIGKPGHRKDGSFRDKSLLKQVNYIDLWFQSIVKPKCFYEKHADSTV
jgi:hypothetical protein